MRAVVARLAEEGEAFFTNASPIAAGVPRAPTMNLSILITAYLAVYAATTGKTAPDVAEDLKPIVDPSGDKAKTTALRIAHLLADRRSSRSQSASLAMRAAPWLLVTPGGRGNALSIRLATLRTPVGLICRRNHRGRYCANGSYEIDGYLRMNSVPGNNQYSL